MMRPNMPTFIVIISVSIGVITFSVSAFGQCPDDNYYWVAGTGDWSTPENWQHQVWDPNLNQCVLVAGVPGTEDLAQVTNGGTVFISDDAYLSWLLIGSDSSASVSGTLVVSDTIYLNNNGRCEQVAGVIVTPYCWCGDETGASFIQTGGKHIITEHLFVDGTYELTGDGELYANNIQVTGRYELTGNGKMDVYNYMGVDGAFVQAGGTNRVEDHLYITPNGRYELTGDGKLDINDMSVIGVFIQSGGTNTAKRVHINGNDQAKFVQTAGITNVIEWLDIGFSDVDSATYDLSGSGELQIGGAGLIGAHSIFVTNGGTIRGLDGKGYIAAFRGHILGPGTYDIDVSYVSDANYGTWRNDSVAISFVRKCLTVGGHYSVKQITPSDFVCGNVPNLLESSVFDVNFDGSFCGEFIIEIPYDESEVNALGVDEMSLVILHETSPGTYEQLADYMVGDIRNVVCAKARTFGKFAVAVSTVAVVELEALNDIPICDDNGNPIESIWRKEFDDSGTLVDSNPPEDHSVVSSMTSGGFKMRARLAGWPINPGFVPNLKCRWAVGNLSQETDFDIRNPGELIYESKHYIRVPQSVGKYTLALHFSIYKEDTWIADCPPIYRTLYVMFDDPSRNEIDINVQRPKEKWMEEVTHWAAGARDRGSVLQMIVDGIYYWARDHGWIYVPGESQSSTHWVDLIDGSSTRANCVPMASLWEKAARILGVKNVATTWTKGKPTSGDCGEAEENAPGFLTIKAAAFDVTAKGNASEWLGSDPDRWLFESHYVGKTCGWFGLFPTYYDPTLGETWQRLSQFIKCCVLTSEWYTDPVSRYPRKDLEGGAYIVDYNTPAIGHRLVYHGLTGESTLQDVQHMFTRTEDATVTFTGGCSAFGSDDNNDSRFDRLVTISEVIASAPTEFRVFGVVTCGTTFVTQRASKNSTMQTSVTVAGQMGLNTVELSFSGFDINSSETDGPYTVTLYLCDTSGSLVDQVEFLTDPYGAAQFGETSAQIVRVSDSAMDVDGDALFDSLVIATDISIFREGLYYLSASLVDSNGLFITSSDANAYFPVGIHKVDVSFDCREINKSAEVNTYLVEMTVFSADGEQQDDTSFVTSAYQPNTFERKAVLISSSCSDYGVDSDGDGLFDFLRLEVGFDVAETNSYSITAWLQDPNGTDITFAEVYLWLDQGRQTVAVDFAGSAIWTVGLDGPYSVIYLLIRNDDRIVDAIRNLHTTSGYIHSQFDANILTDFTGDNKVDFRDFAKLALYWLQYDPSSDVFPPISGDGIVNVLDLAVVAEHWLEGTTP